MVSWRHDVRDLADEVLIQIPFVQPFPLVPSDHAAVREDAYTTWNKISDVEYLVETNGYISRPLRNYIWRLTEEWGTNVKELHKMKLMQTPRVKELVLKWFSKVFDDWTRIKQVKDSIRRLRRHNFYANHPRDDYVPSGSEEISSDEEESDEEESESEQSEHEDREDSERDDNMIPSDTESEAVMETE